MATQLADPHLYQRVLLRDERGRALPVPAEIRQARAIERFRRLCRFDPFTGCVVWIGGTTRGRGNSAVYGSFWYEGRRWYAHRWSAVFIHGLDVGDLTVGHCCKHTPDKHPNTLCVEHVFPQTLRDNVIEGNVRRALRAQQTNEERKYWLLVDRGYEQAPPVHDPETADNDDFPWFTPPAWLGDQGVVSRGADCPF